MTGMFSFDVWNSDFDKDSCALGYPELELIIDYSLAVLGMY